MRWLDELEVGATQGGGDPLVRTYNGRRLEGYFHKMRVEEHAAFMNAIRGQVPVWERSYNQSKAGRTKEKYPETSSAGLREKLISPKQEEELKRSIQKHPMPVWERSWSVHKLEELKRSIQKHPVPVTLLTLISCHFHQLPSREAWYSLSGNAHNIQGFLGIRNNKHYVKDN